MKTKEYYYCKRCGENRRVLMPSGRCEKCNCIMKQTLLKEVEEK